MVGSCGSEFSVAIGGVVFWSSWRDAVVAAFGIGIAAGYKPDISGLIHMASNLDRSVICPLLTFMRSPLIDWVDFVEIAQQTDSRLFCAVLRVQYQVYSVSFC